MVAQMIPMRIDLWHNLKHIFYTGIAEEDGSDKQVIFSAITTAHIDNLQIHC